MPPWRLESTNILGSFPDCSFSAQVLQVPRTRAVTASGQSLVASLTVPFSTQAYIAGGKLLGAENVLGGVQTCDEGCRGDVGTHDLTSTDLDST